MKFTRLLTRGQVCEKYQLDPFVFTWIPLLVEMRPVRSHGDLWYECDIRGFLGWPVP